MTLLGFFVVVIWFLLRFLFPSTFSDFASLVFANNSFFGSLQANYEDKESLLEENKTLRSGLLSQSMEAYSGRINQNFANELYKQVHTEGEVVTISEVLLRPPFAAYDTYVIKGGSIAGVQKNQLVVAAGVQVLGYVDAVTEHYSRVRLFSSADHEQTLSVDGFLFDSVGRGSGTIEIRLPRNFANTQDQVVKLPGASNLIVGGITVTEFDPQDSYVTGIVAPAVNILQQELVTVVEQEWEDVAALDLEQFNNTDNAEDSDAQ